MNRDFAKDRSDFADLCQCPSSDCACTAILESPEVCADCTNGEHTSPDESEILDRMLDVREEIKAAENILKSGEPCVVAEVYGGALTGVRTRGLPKNTALFEVDYDNLEGADQESIDKLERTLHKLFDDSRGDDPKQITTST